MRSRRTIGDVTEFMIRSRELAWAAGLFDATAYMTLYQRDRFKANWSPRIVLASDRELPLLRFQSTVQGGSVHRLRPRSFRWTVNGAKGCLEVMDLLESDRVGMHGEREFRSYCELVRRPRPVRDRTLTYDECLERTERFCDWMKVRLRMPSSADPTQVMASIMATGTLNSRVGPPPSGCTIFGPNTGTGIST